VRLRNSEYQRGKFKNIINAIKLRRIDVKGLRKGRK